MRAALESTEATTRIPADTEFRWIVAGPRRSVTALPSLRLGEGPEVRNARRHGNAKGSPGCRKITRIERGAAFQGTITLVPGYRELVPLLASRWRFQSTWHGVCVPTSWLFQATALSVAAEGGPMPGPLPLPRTREGKVTSRASRATTRREKQTGRTGGVRPLPNRVRRTKGAQPCSSVVV